MQTQMEAPAPVLGGWFMVSTGRKFYILNPRVEDVDIRDIAHSLSLICRYGGHCREHYSVGQHSLYCSARAVELEADPLLQMHVLLHDAAECYLGDIVRPYKETLPSFSKLEDETMTVIYEALNLQLPTLEDEKFIKRVDNEVLLAERRDIVNHANIPWNIPAVAWGKPIQPVPDQKLVERLFLSRYTFLRACLGAV